MTAAARPDHPNPATGRIALRLQPAEDGRRIASFVPAPSRAAPKLRP